MGLLNSTTYMVVVVVVLASFFFGDTSSLGSFCGATVRLVVVK